MYENVRVVFLIWLVCGSRSNCINKRYFFNWLW